LLEAVREETGVEAHLCWRRSSSVGRGLHELCELIGADLVTVGSSRRGLLGRVLIGDDTSAALNGAPCSIAIAPTNYAQQPGAMREIGVGYDGSPENEHALSVARMLFGASGAKLSALEVVSLPSDAFLGPGAVDNTPQRLLEDARERIAALGGVEPHAAYGQPAEELGLYSASLDLLIVGSRGYGPIGRLIHGSTSQQLAHSARCPLLVLARMARPNVTDGAAENGREGRVPLKG
jgi:nucleotide-binding universal stress UspA family protein